MTKSIRHLRATSDEWALNDIVIPDGELALEITRNGTAKMRFGNGESPFSKLRSVTGDTAFCQSGDLTLYSGVRYRLGEVAQITAFLPPRPDDDYYCEISFDSPADATDFTVTGEKLRLTGDGVADEELLPEPSTHYTVFIWYDGEYQGVVRGISNAT